jgi:eukaryotic-like serine/threonine-protein kinase
LNAEKETSSDRPAVRTVGRYLLSRAIARGGMAAVHLARLEGDEGFTRVVAAKRLHEQFAEDDNFVTMFLDEARIASKIHHPNVVPVLDVIRNDGEIILIQDYVHGVPLDRLVARLRDKGGAVPVGIALGILVPALHGLQSAHDVCDEFGRPLHVVHRDVSPQNILVSVEGIPRLIDFGIAKASSSAHVTKEGLFKGKVAYMSSEQLRGEETTHLTDIYAAGMILWELLAARRAYAGLSETQIFAAVLAGKVPSLRAALAERTVSAQEAPAMDALVPIVHKALSLDPNERYQSAAEMADALTAVHAAASAKQVSTWVKDIGADYLAKRDLLRFVLDCRALRSAVKAPSAVTPLSRRSPLCCRPIRKFRLLTALLRGPANGAC